MDENSLRRRDDDEALVEESRGARSAASGLWNWMNTDGVGAKLATERVDFDELPR